MVKRMQLLEQLELPQQQVERKILLKELNRPAKGIEELAVPEGVLAEEMSDTQLFILAVGDLLKKLEFVIEKALLHLYKKSSIKT